MLGRLRLWRELGGGLREIGGAVRGRTEALGRFRAELEGRQRRERIVLGKAHSEAVRGSPLRPRRAGESDPRSLALGVAPLHPLRPGEPVGLDQRSGQDPRRAITDYLSQGIESGAVRDRATMVSALPPGRYRVFGFAAPDIATFQNPNILNSLGPLGAEVELAENQEATVTTDLISAEDGNTIFALGR